MSSSLRPFDVPRAATQRLDPSRALVGVPSSFVGRVVCAESDVAPDGTPITDPGEPTKDAGVTPGGIATYAFVFGVFGIGIGFGMALALDAIGVLSMGAGVLPMVVLSTSLAVGGAIVFARWFHRFTPETLYVGEAGLERVKDAGGTLTREGVAYADVVSALRTSVRQLGHMTFLRESLVLLGPGGRSLFTLEGATLEGSAPTTPTWVVRSVSELYRSQRLAIIEARLRGGGSATFPIYGDPTPLVAGGGGFATTDAAIVVSHDRIGIQRGGATQSLALSDLSKLTMMSGFLEIVPRTPTGAPLQFVMNQIGDGDVLLLLLHARGIPMT